MASNASRPAGCGPDVASLYWKLCDLEAVWGVAVAALASAGAVLSLVLFIALLANVPFRRGNAVALHAGFLACTAGLFGLAFAFIVGKNFSTCAARRFLFGVLFAGCFSCLLVEGVRLNALARTKRAPRARTSCLAALALWSVEVLVNAEWLIITVARHPPAGQAAPCDVANADFAMALIYVMVLLVAAVGAGLGAMLGKYKRRRREGALILACALLSVAIWAAWIAMYVHGNRSGGGGPRWDDPTLAVALVANAWLFLALVTIPQVCCWDGDAEFGEEDAGRAVGYENILKQQNARHVFADNVDNKAFTMDEPAQGAKMVSPYSGYTGQLRSCVYQPTELALITKNPPPPAAIPRASAHPAAGAGHVTHAANSGNALHRAPEW